MAQENQLTFPIPMQTLIDTFGEGELIKLIDSMIFNSTLPFPFRTYFMDPPEEMFFKLRSYQSQPRYEKYYLKSYYPKLNPKFRGKLYLPPLFRGRPVYLSPSEKDYREIDSLSDHFIEDIRLLTHRENSPCVMDYWTDPHLRKPYLMKVIQRPILDLPTLRDVLHTMTYESKQFRPTWAKGLLELVLGPYDPKSARRKVLDLSAGWGDRLLGALSAGYSYLGVDPNIDLQLGHSRMIEMCDAQISSGQCQVIYSPFEDASIDTLRDFAPQGFDVILSSPPFFTIELYPGPMETQSTSRYTTIVTWMNRFLFPSLRKAWSVLRLRGYLILHLGDTKEIAISEATNLFIEEYLLGASWEGIIGVASENNDSHINAPPNSPSARPVWVWQKRDPNKDRIEKWNPQIHRSLSELYPEFTNSPDWKLN